MTLCKVVVTEDRLRRPADHRLPTIHQQLDTPSAPAQHHLVAGRDRRPGARRDAEEHQSIPTAHSDITRLDSSLPPMTHPTDRVVFTDSNPAEKEMGGSNSEDDEHATGPVLTLAQLCQSQS
ncbi:hypothetical protein PtB15_2B383 [Puccinia triticina]|nr:hypothetical protein PtB15_2B383 [Puccinia triticina]